MKIKTTATAREFTAENAFDRATLEYPELTFVCHKEATRVLNRCAATLTIKHNGTVVFRGGAQVQGIVDGEEQFDRTVSAMMDRLLTRAAPDLAAWRAANPVPKPSNESKSITSSMESVTTSS